MSTEARALLLSLPVELRRHLAREAKGPGWLCYGEGHIRPAGIWEVSGGIVELYGLRAWLPCDPTEVLRVAAGLVEGRWLLESAAEPGEALASLPNDTHGRQYARCRVGPLVAAIACLAAAWERQD